MILLLLWLAQTPVYTNADTAGVRETYRVVVRTAEKRVTLPPEELAGLYAHQYVYAPPEWRIGATSIVIAADPDWPLPKQTIPNRWYENRWDLFPVIHYHPPIYGPRYSPPFVPGPSINRVGGVRRR